MYKENFDKLCRARGVSASAVMKAIGKSHVAYQKWDDESVPRAETQLKISEYFGVKQSWFFKEHTEDEVLALVNWHGASPADSPSEDVRIPIYGSISAGRGVLAEQDIIGYEYVSPQYANGDYFWLAVRGVSMMPLIQDGDLLLIHRQPTIESGEIGAFILGGEGYVKRYNANGTIKLQSLNPSFSDIVISEGSDFQIVGKVIESRRRF